MSSLSRSLLFFSFGALGHLLVLPGGIEGDLTSTALWVPDRFDDQLPRDIDSELDRTAAMELELSPSPIAGDLADVRLAR